MKNKIVNWIKADYNRVIFTILSLSLLVAMPIMSRDAGMSGDEHFHFKQAENVISFYKTLGKDTSAVSGVGTGAVEGFIMQYGQLPDNISCLIASIFNVEDIVSVRHFVNAIFGWLGVLFAGLLAFRISGNWLAAIITSLLLFLSPRYLGHSFNNLKDAPFAAIMMMGVYYIAYFYQAFPNVSKKVCAMLAVSIGLALAIRVGGILLIAYFGLFGVVLFLKKWIEAREQSKKSKKNTPGQKKELSSFFLQLLKYGIIIALSGYVIGILLWPYALVSPVKNVTSTFATMSQFGAALRQNFEGAMQWSSDFPWYYTPKFILITIPIAAIFGAIAYPFIGGLKKSNRFTTFLVYFAFIFPVFWIVYSNANVYGGWRHSLFAYPPMAVAAGLGFNALIGIARQKYLKIALTVLPFVFLIPPAIFIVKNHPYEYTFFNQCVGGIKGTYGNYEMDYYYHSTREAAEWVLADIAQNGAPDSTRKTRVVSWHTSSVAYYTRKDTANVSVGFARWYERGYNDWDYAIFTVTGMNPELLKNKKAFPPRNTAYQVKVDDVPICIVLKREDKSDFYGHKAMQEGNIGEAVPLLRKALEYDEYNEQALADLITIYQQTDRLDSALALARGWVAFNKGNTTALNALANIYFSKGDFSSAIVTANAIIKYNSRDISGLWIVANAQAQQGQLNDALRTLQKLLSLRGDFKPAYQLMAQIYAQSGDRQRAQQIINAMNGLR